MLQYIVFYDCYCSLYISLFLFIFFILPCSPLISPSFHPSNSQLLLCVPSIPLWPTQLTQPHAVYLDSEYETRNGTCGECMQQIHHTNTHGQINTTQVYTLTRLHTCTTTCTTCTHIIYVHTHTRAHNHNT